MAGTESPTKSAMSNSEVIATRFSACRPVEHEAGRPFEDSARARADQAPADQEERKARGRKAHGDHEKHETTSIEIVPSANTRDARILAVASWDSTPDEKTTNSVAPASACEGW